MTIYRGVLTGDDGSELVISGLEVRAPRQVPPAPVPVPAPAPGQVPTGANLVRIGGATYPLAGVNPTPASNPAGAPFPGVRGPDQMVLAKPPWSRTQANAFGAEVPVVRGVVAGAVVSGLDGGIPIQADGYVLSGHGRAATWLQEHATPGAVVELVHAESTPAPAAGRTLAVYMMDGVGTISQIPAQVNQVRVAFLQGSRLVEWGGDTPAKTIGDLTSWRRPSRTVLISIGGQGGAVAEAGVAAAIRTVEAIPPVVPVDGIDWDKEGGALDIPAAVAASRELARGREGSWITSFVPSGGPPVDVYLEAARQCQAAGLRVQFGQQLYDAVVTKDQALGALGRAVNVLGQEAVLVGMMCPAPGEAADKAAKRWAVEQCEAVMTAAVARWPRIGGAYLWESSRPRTGDWAARVGAVLGL